MTDQPKPKTYQCRHIHTAGNRCGSPSLRGEQFCFYHHTTRRPPRHLGIPPNDAVFTLPPIEDRASIQHALAEVMARIAANSLDCKRAGLLLYALQIASLNLSRNLHTAPSTTAGPDPEPSEVNECIQDLELDPDLGPLAPVAEVGAPSAARASLIQRFLDDINRPKIPCARCEETDRLAAARVLVATLPIVD